MVHSTDRYEDVGENAVLLQGRRHPAPNTPRPNPYRKHIGTLFAFLLLTEASNFLQIAPMTAIMESIICGNYYRDVKSGSENWMESWPDRRRCKIEPVQSELATVRGWQQLFECLASILVAVPFSFMANKYGRKPVLSLAMFGLILSRAWIQVVCWWPEIFPLRLSWISSLCLLIGGGNLVSGSLIYTIMTDLTVPEHRASIFLFMNAAVLIAEMLLVPLASTLMRHDPWIPVNIGLGTIAIGCFITLTILPETARLQGIEVSEETEYSPDESSFFSEAKAAFDSSKNVLSLLSVSREAVALMIASTMTNMDRSSNPYFIQYVSKRFNWDISKASLLMSYRAAFNLVLSIVLLPLASHILRTKFNVAAKIKDLWLTRFSAIVLCIGSALMAVAPNIFFLITGLTIFAQGYGLSALLHSLATSVVEPRNIVIVYNVMSVAETTGDLTSGPILSSMFSFGQRLGGGWLGLFMMVMMVFYLVATTTIFAIRCHGPPNAATVDQEEDGYSAGHD